MGTPTRVGHALGELAITSRPLYDYRNMLLLSDAELVAGPILDCPAGASPFGAQVRARGGTVISVDPAYRMPGAELVTRARSDLTRIADWCSAYPDQFDWSYLGSVDSFVRGWELAIDLFAADFAPDGERYVSAALLELVRVTRGEVRVFPLVDSASRPYPWLAEFRTVLSEHGVHTDIVTAGCAFNLGGDRMLRCHRTQLFASST